MNDKHIHSRLENFFSDTITNSHSVGGGCIADARIVEFTSGNSVFVKSGFSNGMFLNEANGLQEMAKANAIRVPEVYLCGKDFIAMEVIRSGNKRSDFFELMGQRFAKLHRYTSPTFGFFEDNFIGASVQRNISEGKAQTDWPTFFWQHRLWFQYKMAEENGYATSELQKSMQKLEDKLEQILSGSEEAPTLLHGDLWGGNYMVDEKGEPVLIDPAVYYGHREADLAMTTIFGGFTPEFYQAYHTEYPLKDGWEYRQNIYKLYHILNHLNLFGSGYYTQALQLVNSYL